MSEQSQGPGWWQASDGKWYSPDQTSADTPPAYAAPATATAAGGGGGNGKVIAAIVALVVVAAAAVFFITRDSGSSSGSVGSFCAEVKRADAAFSDQSLTKSNADAFVAEFDKLANAAPNEIKADMDTLDAAAKKSAAALKSGKSSDDTFSSSERTKLDQASARLNSFAKTKCGVDLNGNSDTDDFSLNSDFGSDFDSFQSEFSDSFSDFDSDFFSSFDSEN